MSDEEIDAVLAVVAAILHLGNIQFDEDDREVGRVTNANALAFPAFLLGFDQDELHQKLLTHRMETKWGKSNEVINVEVRLQNRLPIRASGGPNPVSKWTQKLPRWIEQSVSPLAPPRTSSLLLAPPRISSLFLAPPRTSSLLLAPLRISSLLLVPPR